MEPEMPHIPDSPQSEWDINVLNLISEEGLTRFTFDGLKRRLGAHPETLSRALFRLEDQGMIEKILDGYKVTPKLRKLLSTQQLSANERSVPVLQTLLPLDITAKQAVSDLAGKWFGTLRWLGYAKSSESVILKWITEDSGIQVDAIFSDGALSIEVKMLSEKDLNIALRASHQLFAYISRIYSGSGRVQHVAYFTNFGLCHTLQWM